jgi:hypothetical protein
VSRHYAILCDVRRLKAYDEAGTNTFCFSLNITVGVNDPGGAPPTPDDRFDLFPWLWDLVNDGGRFRVAVALRLGGATPTTTFHTGQVIPFPDVVTSGNRERIRMAAEGELPPRENWFWAPPAAGVVTEEGADEGSRSLPGYMSYLSTWPSPMPQTLNLSLCFTVQLAGLTESADNFVFAAPVFQRRPGAGAPADEPDNAKMTFEATGLSSWEYKTNAGQPLYIAYGPALPFVAPPDQKYIRMSDLLINWPANEASSYGENWAQTLAGRAATAFDLPQRLADALRQNLGDAAFLAAYKEAEYRKAFIGALRDQAGVGLVRGPSGQRLADTLLLTSETREVRGLLSEDAASNLMPDARHMIAALELYDRSLRLDETVAVGGATINSWVGLLREQLPELAGTSVLRDFAGQPGTPSPTRPAALLSEEVNELERIQSVLADEQAVRRLVLAQWRAASTLTPEATAFWTANAVEIERRIGVEQVRAGLAVANINDAWPQLIDLQRVGGDQFAALKSTMRTQLVRYFRERLEREEPNPPAGSFLARMPRLSRPGAPVSLPPQVVTSIENFVDHYVETGVKPEGDDTPTKVPHPFAFQVDQLGPAGVGDDGDLLRQLSGVGLLIRKVKQDGVAAPGFWRCLNMAAIETHAATPFRFVPATLVAQRLHYQDEMRQAFVTYDNQPLIAVSPAHDLSHELPPPDPAGVPQPLFDYTYNLDPADPLQQWSTLPALVFGREYEALPFCVNSAGALPKVLSAGHPARLRQFESGFELTGAAATLTRTLSYKRRVPVGQIRIAGAEKAAGDEMARNLALPPIPPDVSPIARELVTPEQEEPLLLLKNGADSFNFRILRPATDLVTWDRWVGGDDSAANREKRIGVWADYHEKAPKPHDLETPAGVKALTGRDLSIEDPAVDQAVHVTLEKLFGPGDPVAPKAVTLPAPHPLSSGEVTLRQVQSDPLPVVCNVGPRAEIRPEPEDGSPVRRLVITVPEGSVWRLKISSRVSKEMFRKRFSIPPQAEQAGDFFLFSPLSFLIEVATPALPNAEEVWRALVPTFADGKLEVLLDPERLEAGVRGKFVNVRYVQLQRQLWRPTGRPFFREQDVADMDGEPFTQLGFMRRPPGAPLELDPDPAPAERRLTSAMRWEVIAFGDRRDSDHLMIASTLKVTARSFAPGGTFRRADKVIHDEDLTGDRRAHYYRFSVEVFSRYKGLFPKVSVASQLGTRPHGTAGSRFLTSWRRLFVPCRWPAREVEAVPKPLVKLVVPLTEAGPGSGISARPGAQVARASDLLVVLNEPWFEKGGLAETLAVEITRAEATRDGVPAAGSEFEFGPDSILTGDSLGVAGFESNAPLGPIGHSFDTNTDAPLFVASSFILPPPTLRDPEAEKDFSWYFARLRFKRVLTAEALAGSNGDAESELTDAYWVQYLPDASRLVLDGLGDWDDLSFRFAGGQNGELVFFNRKTRLDVPVKSASHRTKYHRFTLWAVLTQVIRDAIGRPDQEKYVTLYQLNDDGRGVVFENFPRPEPGADKVFRVRLLEVQERIEAVTPGVAVESDPWRRLFPAFNHPENSQAQEEDAKARIVRAFRPVNGGEKT